MPENKTGITPERRAELGARVRHDDSPSAANLKAWEAADEKATAADRKRGRR